MHLARATIVLCCLALPWLAACESSPKQVDASVPPPPQTSGKPAYLSPRSDGTYVDVNGHILTPPPVMLGVTMEQPGQALVKHMGINPARSTLLVDVIPGLPAAAAGLEDHDLVIAVNGSSDASPHDIRNILKRMKPGDAITLTVRRGPATRTATLKATAWQAEHMVRPIHAGSFSKPGLSEQSDKDSAPRELAPVMDRLDRIEKQLQQLNAQVNTAKPATTTPPAAAPAGKQAATQPATPSPR